MLQPLSTIELQRYDWLDRASADQSLPDIARKLAQRIGSAYACERADYACFEVTKAAEDLGVSEGVIHFALSALLTGNYLRPLAYGASRRDRSTYRLNFVGDNSQGNGHTQDRRLTSAEARS
jgi:hypothetical protein